MSDTKLVTVLMPVYNAERYLAEAIESILHQTYHDFEFMIINDGSTDQSEKIILNYQQQDDRINYVKNSKNLKLIATLNKGVRLAKGKYIVRMDADDISTVDRIEKQVAYMESHHSVGVCGSYFRVFGEEIKNPYIVKRPLGDKVIKASMLFTNPVGHPNVIIRKSIMVDNNLWYDTRFYRIEDWGLWTTLINKCDFANLPEVLLYYRKTDTQETALGAIDPKAIEFRSELVKENCQLHGFNFSDKEILLLQFVVGNDTKKLSYRELKDGLNLLRLYIHNDATYRKVALGYIKPKAKHSIKYIIAMLRIFEFKSIF